ncbi:MAG: hypothetical protein DRG78_00080 [Epsilonproteobacteria bacterium]|nr:MAG: hypothetical protein DRG78_00080 [Campylobacterota bacterium]
MNEKQQMHLQRIEMRFPSRTKLNQGQMLECINKSRSTFKRLIDSNKLHLLPKFIVINGKNDYKSYEFDIFDIAEFLSN